ALTNPQRPVLAQPTSISSFEGADASAPTPLRAVRWRQTLDFRNVRGQGVRRALPHGLVGEAAAGAGQHLVVAYVEGLDPALLAERETDEEPQLDQLLSGEVSVQALPERVVGDAGVPHDGAGPGQGRLLTLAEAVRILEVQELVVLGLIQAVRRTGGALDASILTVDRPGHVDATELLQGLVTDAVPEREVPRLAEGADHGRDVSPDCLTLRPRRAV